jgi:hypothetical protein
VTLMSQSPWAAGRVVVVQHYSCAHPSVRTTHGRAGVRISGSTRQVSFGARAAPRRVAQTLAPPVVLLSFPVRPAGIIDCGEATVRYLGCVYFLKKKVPCKKKIPVTSNLRYMHGVLNVDEKKIVQLGYTL